MITLSFLICHYVTIQFIQNCKLIQETKNHVPTDIPLVSTIHWFLVYFVRNKIRGKIHSMHN